MLSFWGGFFLPKWILQEAVPQHLTLLMVSVLPKKNTNKKFLF